MNHTNKIDLIPLKLRGYAEGSNHDSVHDLFQYRIYSSLSFELPEKKIVRLSINYNIVLYHFANL